MRVSELYFNDVITTSGADALLVVTPTRVIWIQGEAVYTCTKMVTELARNGILLTDKNPAEALRHRLQSRKTFEGPPPIDRPGWSGCNFAWPDGSVSVPRRSPVPETIYRRQPGMFQPRGSRNRWKTQVAEPFHNEPLVAFAMLLPLAALIRPFMQWPHNALFEIVTPSLENAGLLYAIGSVTGGLGAENGYPAISFLEAVRLMESIDPMDGHLRVVTGTKTFFASRMAGARANEASKLVSEELRSLSGGGCATHTTLLIHDVPLAAQVGEGSGIGTLIAERTISLRVPATNQHGIYEQLPEDMTYATERTAALARAVATCRGTIYRGFLERVVRTNGATPRRFQRRLRELLDVFRSHAPVNLHDSAAVRIADEFGMVFAAGRLAKEWGLIPEAWHTGELVRRCYVDYYVAPGPVVPFEQEVRALLGHPNALHIGVGRADADNETLEAADLIIERCRAHVDVVIRPPSLNKYIPNGSRRLQDPEVRAIMRRDGRHDGVKKRNITGDNRRLYVFRLPIEEPDSSTADS